MKFLEKIKSKNQRVEKIIGYVNFEALFWIITLIYLGAGNFEHGTHFSFCPLHNLGINFCPGCGLGRSISFLLHGELLQSFHTHWLGPFAFVVIILRILQIIKFTYFKIKFV
jgi:hypothetical protein